MPTGSRPRFFSPLHLFSVWLFAFSTTRMNERTTLHTCRILFSCLFLFCLSSPRICFSSRSTYPPIGTQRILDIQHIATRAPLPSVPFNISINRTPKTSTLFFSLPQSPLSQSAYFWSAASFSIFNIIDRLTEHPKSVPPSFLFPSGSCLLTFGVCIGSVFLLVVCLVVSFSGGFR